MQKRVLLLGDSIRMGYEKYVEEGLGEKINTVYSEENGRDVSTTLWQANQFFKEMGDFDVIHWNNGYWDLNPEAPMTESFHPLDEYVHFLIRMVKFFSQHTDKLIFATTLPVFGKGTVMDNTGTGGLVTYDKELVINYNCAATAVMNQYDVTINDLYEFALQDKNLYKGPDMLHLSDEGNHAVADEIVEVINTYLS